MLTVHVVRLSASPTCSPPLRIFGQCALRRAGCHIPERTTIDSHPSGEYCVANITSFARHFSEHSTHAPRFPRVLYRKPSRRVRPLDGRSYYSRFNRSYRALALCRTSLYPCAGLLLQIGCLRSGSGPTLNSSTCPIGASACEYTPAGPINESNTRRMAWWQGLCAVTLVPFAHATGYIMARATASNSIDCPGPSGLPPRSRGRRKPARGECGTVSTLSP